MMRLVGVVVVVLGALLLALPSEKATAQIAYSPNLRPDLRQEAEVRVYATETEIHVTWFETDPVSQLTMGQDRVIRTEPTLRGVALSRDGRTVAFGTANGLCRINVDGTRFRRLTFGTAEYPSWKWDGRSLVFAGWHSDELGYRLYSVGVNGGELEQVPTGNYTEHANEVRSACGPGSIFYEVWYFGVTIWRYDEATGTAAPFVPLTTDWYELLDQFWYMPAISPDGQTLVYNHRDDDAEDRLYLIGTDDTTGEGTLLHQQSAWAPIWLEDGTIDAIHPESWEDSDGWHTLFQILNFTTDGSAVDLIMERPERIDDLGGGQYMRLPPRLAHGATQ